MPRFYRKIIRIRGEDSPNVALALLQEAGGGRVTHEMLVDGVLPYADYRKRRATWDPVRQSVGLDAMFWEGIDALMFPPDWLNAAERYADLLEAGAGVPAEAIGVDPAEGGDDSAWVVGGRRGVKEVYAEKTPDTNRVNDFTKFLMRKHKIRPENVVYDRGNGGKVHADRMREAGFPVRTVGFGEAVANAPEGRKNKRRTPDVVEEVDQRYVYKNRRAQMYGWLREAIDPGNGTPFAIPARFAELRRQLAPIPLLYDGEGRVYLPPKDKPSPTYKGQTLRDMLGRSPDEADATVLMLYGVLSKPPTRTAAGGTIDTYNNG